MSELHKFWNLWDEAVRIELETNQDNSVDNPYLFDWYEYTHIKFAKWYHIYPNGQVEGPFL